MILIMYVLITFFLYSRACPSLGASVSHDLLLGRWRLSLDLFGRVFTEDVGLEPGSVVAELGGFPVKEVKFRRDMEKLRNSQQRDLTLHKVKFYIHNTLTMQTLVKPVPFAFYPVSRLLLHGGLHTKQML